ncbi:hypothetical protein GE21DRAFT_4147 [Neurospora crassa]|uniref:Autophagy-related protein 101 n=1 Tax=Neurospora crassa (strain ATCC 24698 / 74-OR23-1A / CBS 708.71 / DSM 1257 / FGSC 987) TaxID=367110 RepID=Q7SAR5_NEUCR|nr:DUF1649 domain-containing protein [Neurospora crassa OR74A]EAA33483.2 DUF1649 domain-containing protein [Neurospora crassa OR74A]KHE86990.1 hypothetical protein GE21DRAFT_4147 [Neurospora crassa]|eukprot:XP_962719.2 DUF1649 domain-containing protein [Neurospora crassa OR74A]
MEKVAPEFTLEAFADPASVRDVVRGILHTIFFLRYFVSHEPKTRDVCGLELAYIPDAEIETLIDQRVATLVRQLEVDRNQSSSSQHPYGGGGPGYSGGGGGRGQITVQFFEKKRRKTWYGMGRGDDEVCWENWTVKVTVAEPRTESERHKVRNAMESTLQSTVFKCITIANTHKDHIPPITTNDSNPFTYQIHVNPHHGLHVTSQQHLQSASSKEAAARSDFGSSGNGGSSSGTGGSGRGAGRGGAGGLAGAAGGAAAAVVGSWATRMGIY